jgi:hypothetical protein
MSKGIGFRRTSGWYLFTRDNERASIPAPLFGDATGTVRDTYLPFLFFNEDFFNADFNLASDIKSLMSSSDRSSALSSNSDN